MPQDYPLLLGGGGVAGKESIFNEDIFKSQNLILNETFNRSYYRLCHLLSPKRME
jgi:hypothetical protein